MWYAYQIMQKLTPDWNQIYSDFLYKLDEVGDNLQESVEQGEDPMSAVNAAFEELQEFITAVNGDLN